MKGMRNIAPFGLRMPDDLRQAVQEQAQANGRSMNSEIIEIISNSLFFSSINQDAVDYVLGTIKQDDFNNISDEEREHVMSLLIQAAEKLAKKIEKESTNLRQILDLISNNRKPT
ncbi:Arc family DNA-binding protein [Serratia marcescens]|uniref:Arc family DNA-binding protein n=1 Tax=Serratia marcescens TaxID=615 RepID=UPI001153C372|nr:Arc family DNA-binding protein [Serratia marcescens]QDI22308.1 Arc family DNA-binding protein [Serratia marcescens]